MSDDEMVLNLNRCVIFMSVDFINTVEYNKLESNQKNQNEGSLIWER